MTGTAPEDYGSVRSVFADLAVERGPMNRMYNFCVGAGRANEGLRADWQRQLRHVHGECGFRYIRFHGLFCDDMGVYSEDKQGRAIYNWQYVDELFDFLLGIGMKPFVELSFMPAALASSHQTIFWYRANVTPPKDYAKWEALVVAFARHVTDRYGVDEVRTWYFEVWNEPNLQAFWNGMAGCDATDTFDAVARAEYLRLYEHSARAVKSVDREYRVGGPATAGSAWIPEMLASCQERQLPLDFVSTHSYATMAGYLDETGEAGTIFSPNPLAITDEVKGVRAYIDNTNFAGVELHYTEWSSSYTPTDPLHDSYHSAAFILDKLRHIDSAATSMSYWTFTDIFEEHGPRVGPLHGGFGMLNYQDLAKPAYYAYRFLHRLGDVELVCTDPNAYVSRDDSGGVQALFWDFTITHPGPSIINQEYYREDCPAAPKGEVTLQLTQLRHGAYRLVAHRVGYRHHDIQSAWRDLGSPAHLTRNDIEQLRAAVAAPAVLDETIQIGTDGKLTRCFPMRENDVWLVELTPVST